MKHPIRAAKKVKKKEIAKPVKLLFFLAPMIAAKIPKTNIPSKLRPKYQINSLLISISYGNCI
jgi:hypothetical protein